MGKGIYTKLAEKKNKLSITPTVLTNKASSVETKKESNIETKIETKRQVLVETKIPTKQEIEQYLFQYRELPTDNKNMEIPREWLQEITRISKEMDLKAEVQLYRYIIGQFLGKVRK